MPSIKHDAVKALKEELKFVLCLNALRKSVWCTEERYARVG
jgi:hypothetical protein